MTNFIHCDNCGQAEERTDPIDIRSALGTQINQPWYCLTHGDRAWDLCSLACLHQWAEASVTPRSWD